MISNSTSVVKVIKSLPEKYKPYFVAFIIFLFNTFLHFFIRTNSSTEYQIGYLYYSQIISLTISFASILVVVLIGWRYISSFSALTAGIILSLFPIFFSLPSLINPESTYLLFYTSAIYFYLRFLEFEHKKKPIMPSILLGCAIYINFSGVSLYFLLVILTFVWSKGFRKITNYILIYRIVFIFLIAISFYFFLSLLPALNSIPAAAASMVSSSRILLSLIISKSTSLIGFNGISSLISIIALTPNLILVLLFYGVRHMLKQKSWILSSVVIWLIVPIVFTLFYSSRTGSATQVELLAPLSLISAFGLEKLSRRVSTSNQVEPLILFAVIVYLLVVNFINEPINKFI